MTRTVDFRYNVTRDGAHVTTIIPSDGGEPTIRCDDSSEIHMSLSGDFLPNEKVNWLTDRINPEIIIDGISYPLGVYLPVSVENEVNSSEKTVHIEAFDLCWMIQDYKTEDMLYFQSGMNYIDAVQALLTDANIGQVLITPADYTLTEDRSDWEIGTSYLTIINELLAEINYKSLWFNHSGTAVIEPESVPSAENIRHIIDSNAPDCLVLPGITTTTDIYTAPNVFIVICDNPAKRGGILVSKVENNNPTSPLSVQARGRRIVSYEKVQNIANQDALDEYASRLLIRSMLSGEVAQIQTALKYGWTVGDITAVNYESFQAVCVEHEWEMELRVGGTMRHSLERIVANL